jgi:hypothetical protein
MPRPAAAEIRICRSIILFIRITIPHLDSTRSEYVGSTRLPQGQKNSKLRQLVRGGLNGQNRVLRYRSLSPAFYPGESGLAVVSSSLPLRLDVVRVGITLLALQGRVDCLLAQAATANSANHHYPGQLMLLTWRHDLTARAEDVNSGHDSPHSGCHSRHRIRFGRRSKTELIGSVPELTSCQFSCPTESSVVSTARSL